MEFEPMTKETAAEIANEVGINDAGRDSLGQLIAVLEDALEHPEFEFGSVGGRKRYNELRRTERQIVAVRRLIVEAASGSDSDGIPARHMVRIMPLNDDGSVASEQVLALAGLAGSPPAGVEFPSDDGIVLAIANYVLFRLAQSYSVHIAFSAEGNRRPRGRPSNKIRRHFVRTYLEHYSVCVGGIPSYGEKSFCVALCARLLEYYDIDPGDTSQIIKRELARSR